MSKFHISSNGEPAKCTAEIKCRLGGDSGTENHFDTPEEARQAYEKSQASEMIPSISKSDGKKASVNLTTEQLAEKKALAAVALKKFPSFRMSSTDFKRLSKVVETGKVTDKVADELLYQREVLEPRSFYDNKATNDLFVENTDKVFDYLQSLRKASAAPSTLKASNDFDPANETLFSNKAARDNPYVAAKALKKSLDESDRLKNLSYEYSETLKAAVNDNQREAIIGKIKGLEIESKRLAARGEGISKEMLWLAENNKSFRARMDDQQFNSLQNVVKNSKLKNIPILGIKPVK